MHSNTGNTGIVNSVIELARNLDLPIVAEGIEDRQEPQEIVRSGGPDTRQEVEIEAGMTSMSWASDELGRRSGAHVASGFRAIRHCCKKCTQRRRRCRLRQIRLRGHPLKARQFSPLRRRTGSRASGRADVYCCHHALTRPIEPVPRSEAEAQKNKSRGEPRLLFFENLERAMGFEPTTPTLARLCSTPELHPHSDLSVAATASASLAQYMNYAETDCNTEMQEFF